MVRAVRVLAGVVATVLATGCGSSGSGSASPSPSGGGSTLTGPLTVFAAASLTESFNDAKATLQSAHPGLSITYSFAGSQQLVAQIRNGAPADVIATADTTTMDTLSRAGLVDTPRVFAHNKLEIVVAPGNPKGITSLADLARQNLTVVLEDPSVPAGTFARQALRKANVVVNPRSLELDVKSELEKVALGEADAGIVYVTDVTAASSKVSGVAIPDDQNVIATYPIAVVKAASHPSAARAFVDDAVAGTTQRALRARGFQGP
jgi:molybdate transport system substrate-binding protein